MRPANERRPGHDGTGAASEHRTGESRRDQYTTDFWAGWQGPASMAPEIHRKAPATPDTFWKPARAGGAS